MPTLVAPILSNSVPLGRVSRLAQNQFFTGAKIGGCKTSLSTATHHVDVPSDSSRWACRAFMTARRSLRASAFSKPFGSARRLLFRVTRSSNSEEPLCVVDGVSACVPPPQSAQSVGSWGHHSSRHALTRTPFLIPSFFGAVNLPDSRRAYICGMDRETQSHAERNGIIPGP